MILHLGLLASRNALIAAGSVTAMSLAGAGGFLSGAGQVPPVQVRIVPEVTVREIAPVTVTRPPAIVITRPPAVRAPAVTVTAPAPAPGPSAPCTLPPGLCRPRPSPAGSRP